MTALFALAERALNLVFRAATWLLDATQSDDLPHWNHAERLYVPEYFAAEVEW